MSFFNGVDDSFNGVRPLYVAHQRLMRYLEQACVSLFSMDALRPRDLVLHVQPLNIIEWFFLFPVFLIGVLVHLRVDLEIFILFVDHVLHISVQR